MNLEKGSHWSKGFAAFFAPFGSYFPRSESRESAQHYGRGLLGDVGRKNCWQLAEAVGLKDPHALQRVLSEVPWDADAVCGQLRQRVIERLGYERGIGVIDESGFLMKAAFSRRATNPSGWVANIVGGRARWKTVRWGCC